MRYTYATRAAGQRAWEIEYSALTQAEADALVAFFSARGGRYESFTFQDPQDSTPYTVRFDQDELAVTASGRNEHKVLVKLVEVPA
jgi:hypothetical protein